MCTYLWYLLFQALIQYPDVITAHAAILSLDGHIYAGCTLRIEYSKLSNLNVKYNNDKSRDYTNPFLPTGDPALDMNALSLQQSGMHPGLGGTAQAAVGRYPDSVGGQGRVLFVSNMREDLAKPDHLFILFSVYGVVQVNNIANSYFMLIRMF